MPIHVLQLSGEYKADDDDDERAWEICLSMSVCLSVDLCFCLSLTILCKILYLSGRPAEMSDLLFW